METKIALIIAAALVIFWAIIRIRQAGEQVTRMHELGAYDAEVKRAHAHSEEQARKKARQEIAPHLMRPLKDYRNPSQPAPPDLAKVTEIDGMVWDAKERNWVVKS